MSTTSFLPEDYLDQKAERRTNMISLALFAIVMVSVFAAFLVPAGASAKPSRPNVVIFLADDLGWADVGFRDGPIDTPSLDRLAAEGMQLDRFYTTPICSPTRAALMTGRDPIRLGVVYGVILPWSNAGIHPDERFMPEAFRDALDAALQG